MSESPPEVTPITAARADLAEALGTVEGLRVHTDPGKTADPPCVFVSLPDLRWTAFCATPTHATFDVAVVVALDDRAVIRLQELVIVVSAAIDAVPAAVVTTARVGSWNDQLPAYNLEVEMEL